MTEALEPVDVDHALAKLPAPVRARVDAARAGHRGALREALQSLGWPSFLAPIPLADELGTAERALAELLSTMPGRQGGPTESENAALLDALERGLHEHAGRTVPPGPLAAAAPLPPRTEPTATSGRRRRRS